MKTRFEYIVSNSSLPEKTKEELENWSRANVDLLDMLESYSEEQLLLRVCIAIMGEEKTGNFLKMTFIQSEILTASVPVLIDAATRYIQEHEKKAHNLSQGRSKGTEKRQSVAQKKQQILTQALDDLFKNYEGYKMNNDKIAEFLIQRGNSTYSYETTLKKVKITVPAIKKKYKSGL